MLSFIIECTSFKGLLAANLELVFSLVDHEFHGSKTLKKAALLHLLETSVLQ